MIVIDGAAEMFLGLLLVVLVGGVAGSVAARIFMPECRPPRVVMPDPAYSYREEKIESLEEDDGGDWACSRCGRPCPICEADAHLPGALE